MAVAVKNSADVGAAGLLDRIPVVSLAGAVYVLGSLGIVFGLLPALWWNVLGFTQSRQLWVLLVVTEIGVFFALLLLGSFMLAREKRPGVRGGIFLGTFTLLIAALLARWASMLFESWAYDARFLAVSAGSE